MLTITPSVTLSRVLHSGPDGITLSISAVVADVSAIRVSATVDWQDGQTETLNAAAPPLAVTSSRLVKPGFYAVTVRAVNSRFPTPDAVQITFTAQVLSSAGVPAAKPLTIGPILPRDSGAPNAQQWLFDSGSDVGVLESSVKMLLSTQVGERLMSSYGTRLTAILFEPGIAGVESRVREEIVSAFAAWEPRVRLLNVTVDKSSDRAVRVELMLQSILTEENFGTFLEFSPL